MMNLGSRMSKSASTSAASLLLVYRRCCWIIARSVTLSSSSSTGSRSTSPMLHFLLNSPLRSSTYATPPLMPAAKFLPVVPRITTVPPEQRANAKHRM